MKPYTQFIIFLVLITDSAVRIMTSSTAKITLQELEVNTNYSIQVLAFTKVGDGAKSSPVFCKTHEDG